MEKREMCRLIKPYICPICNKETLFFTNKNGYLLDYRSMLVNNQGRIKITMNELINNLEQENVKYIKCINCNREFIIDWRKHWPTILNEYKQLNQFGI